MGRGDLSDAEWELIGPLLPPERGRWARPAGDNRRFLNGMLHVLRVGCPWRDMHERYGKWNSVYVRFRRWAERGVWERIFAQLAGVEGVPDKLFIDSSCIKVHRTAGGAKGGPWLMVSASPKAGVTPSSMPSATRRAARTSSC